MEQQPFYIGQQVIALKTPKFGGFKKGDTVTISDCEKCTCGEWMVGIVECPAPDDSTLHKNDHACYHTGHFTFHGEAKYFAPIERTQTKYVIKEVEVAPQIREMEVQLS